MQKRPFVPCNHCREEFEKLRKEVETLTRLSDSDPLTGLSNRRAYDRVMEQSIAHAIRTSGQVSLLTLDLDNFKKVNDTYGHDAGDMVLKKLAEIILKAMRVDDTPARLGGEEFAIVLPSTVLDSAEWCATRLRKEVEEHLRVEISGQIISVTASLGVAEWDGRESIPDFKKRADVALYHAKRNGRNQVTLSQPARSLAMVA